VPNSDLDPERSDTIELLGRGRLWRLTASWAGYVSLLEGLLKRVPASYQGQGEINGKPVVQTVNAQSGYLYGMEAGLGVDLGRGWSASAELSYAFGREDLGEGGAVPLTSVPPLFGVGRLRYDIELPASWGGFVETYLRWALKQNRLSPVDEKDPRIPQGGTPGWWTWNLRAGLGDHGHHRAVLTVENLLDEDYKYHGSGVWAPGTNAIASYEASF